MGNVQLRLEVLEIISRLDNPFQDLESRCDQMIAWVLKDSVSDCKLESGLKPATNPAVPIADSVHHDYLVCLETGKRFKSLKIHLNKLGLTPHEYRVRWGLPNDYPMICEALRDKCYDRAIKRGLGRKSDKQVKPDENVG